MIDINDADFKLLKMNESLLDKITDEALIKKTLNSYQALAIKIDKFNYNALLELVNNYNHNQSYEEELEELGNLEDNYNQLNEMQHRFRNIYSTYTDDKLELADLGMIDINKIGKRKDTICGYLINAKNIDNCKVKLEEYNEQLVAEEKKRIYNYQKFQRLEEELKNSFINAEGRINALEKYIDIKHEYESNDFDLIKLLDDNVLLEQVFKQSLNLRKEKEEMLETGRICYDKVPNNNNKEILETLKLDAIKTRYRLSLIKIAKLIAEYVDSYDKLIEKREQLLDLINKRNFYLNYLGTYFIVDPFSRIKIQEQIEYINTSLEDNSKVISRVRKNVSEYNNQLEEMIDKNSEFLKNLNLMDKNFIKDTTEFNDIDIPIDETNELIVSEKIKPQNNEVIGLRDINDKFKLDRVREKSTGVIKRVDEMISNRKEENSFDQGTTEILIKQAKSEDIINGLEDIVMPDSEIFPIEDETIQKEIENEVANNTSQPIFMMNDINYSDEEIETVDSKNDLIFQNNIDNPFGEILFFDERRTDKEVSKITNDKLMSSSLETVNEEIEEEAKMPEAFWETKESRTDDVENIDEQIKKLKLVA